MGAIDTKRRRTRQQQSARAGGCRRVALESLEDRLLMSAGPVAGLAGALPELLDDAPALVESVAPSEAPAAAADMQVDTQADGQVDTTFAAKGPGRDRTPASGRPGAYASVLTHYKVHEHWSGVWSDAEKTPTNREDDYMCWAAAAANVLEWTGWGRVDGMTTSDQMFEYFQDHWTDNGGAPNIGWQWWFRGGNMWCGPGGSVVDVPGGGGFFPSENIRDHYTYRMGSAEAMSAVDEYLHDGRGVALGLIGPSGHAVTCWGFSYETGDPTRYRGVWITDSDDDRLDDHAPDELRYYAVQFDGRSWALQDYGGYDTYTISGVWGLDRNPDRLWSNMTVDAGVGRWAGSGKSDQSWNAMPQLSRAQIASAFRAGRHARLYKGIDEGTAPGGPDLLPADDPTAAFTIDTLAIGLMARPAVGPDGRATLASTPTIGRSLTANHGAALSTDVETGLVDTGNDLLPGLDAVAEAHTRRSLESLDAHRLDDAPGNAWDWWSGTTAEGDTDRVSHLFGRDGQLTDLLFPAASRLAHLAWS